MTSLPIRPLDLAIAARARSHGEPELSQFLERMRCIPRFLRARNRRSRRPFGAADLEDLGQTVFERVWSHLDRYEGRANLETWVYRYCTLMYIEQQRRTDRMEYGLTDAALAVDPIEVDPDAGHEEALLHETLNSLPSNEAEVLRLKHLQGLTFAQIGSDLRQSENTVKTRYYRGLERLRVRMKSQRPGAREKA